MAISELGGGRIASLPPRPTAAGRPLAPPAAPGVPVAASAAERELAVAKLRMNTDVQVERLQVVADAVAIAVIQTQDVTALAKEIELKNAKRVTVTELLCDVVMYMVMAGAASMIKDAVKEFAKTTVSGILSTNLAFRVLPLSQTGKNLKALGGDAVAKALESMSRVEGEGRKWLLYSDLVRVAFEKGSDKAADALADLTKRGLGEESTSAGISFTPKAKVAATDLPRAAITRSVLAYVSRHRLAVRLQTDHLEAVIRTGEFTSEQLEKLTSSLVVSAAPDEIDALRTQYALLIEACIWAKLYHLDAGEIAAARVAPKTGYIEGVPNALTDYWWDRFAGLTDLGPWMQDSQAEKSLLLIKLFMSLGKGLNDAIQALGGPTVIDASGGNGA